MVTNASSSNGNGDEDTNASDANPLLKEFEKEALLAQEFKERERERRTKMMFGDGTFTVLM
jgi:hypothetical protein